MLARVRTITSIGGTGGRDGEACSDHQGTEAQAEAVTSGSITLGAVEERTAVLNVACSRCERQGDIVSTA